MRGNGKMEAAVKRSTKNSFPTQMEIYSIKMVKESNANKYKDTQYTRPGTVSWHGLTTMIRCGIPHNIF